jgi:hypothetical protein
LNKSDGVNRKVVMVDLSWVFRADLPFIS